MAETHPIRLTESRDKASIVDVVRQLTGKSAKRSSEMISRVAARHADIASRIEYHIFPKSSNKTPVSTAKTIVELLWLLPINASSKLRKQHATQIHRLLGAETRSTGIAHSNVTTLPKSVVEADKTLTIRKRHRDEMEEIAEFDLRQIQRHAKMEEIRTKAESKQKEHQSQMLSIQIQNGKLIEQVVETYKFDAHMQSAVKDWVMYSLQRSVIPKPEPYLLVNDGSSSSSSSSSSGPTPTFSFCPDISSLVKEMGFPILKSGQLSKCGRMLSARYQEERGEKPPQTQKYVNGAMRQVNTYPIERRAWMREIIREFCTGLQNKCK